MGGCAVLSVVILVCVFCVVCVVGMGMDGSDCPYSLGDINLNRLSGVMVHEEKKGILILFYWVYFR
jgi:hypothetical protein